MSEDATNDDWKAKVNPLKAGWTLRALKLCPLDFPAEWLANIPKIKPNMVSGLPRAETFITPDGRSLQHWVAFIQDPNLIRNEDEFNIFEVEHHIWLSWVVDGMDDEWSAMMRRTHDGMQEREAADEIAHTVNELMAKTMSMRQKLTDEQLLRFQRKFWEDKTIWLARQLLWQKDRLQGLKDILDPVLAELTKQRAEDEQGFVEWSEQDHRNEIEESRAARAARDADRANNLDEAPSQDNS